MNIECTVLLKCVRPNYTHTEPYTLTSQKRRQGPSHLPHQGEAFRRIRKELCGRPSLSPQTNSSLGRRKVACLDSYKPCLRQNTMHRWSICFGQKLRFFLPLSRCYYSRKPFGKPLLHRMHRRHQLQAAPRRRGVEYPLDMIRLQGFHRRSSVASVIRVHLKVLYPPQQFAIAEVAKTKPGKLLISLGTLMVCRAYTASQIDYWQCNFTHRCRR